MWNNVIHGLHKAEHSQSAAVSDTGDIELMIIDEDVPLDFMGVVYTMRTLSIMKKSFLVPKNKQDFIPLHKNTM